MASPNLDIAGNKVCVSLGRTLAKLDLFVHDYVGEPKEKGSTVKVPVISTSAGLFDGENNGYQQQPGQIDTVEIAVSAQPIAGYTVTPKQLSDGLGAYNGVFERMGEDSARAIARKAEEMVVGQVKAPAAGAENLALTKTGFTNLYKVAWDHNLRIEDCVLVLNPRAYAKMLDTVNGTIVNLQAAIESGKIDNFLGFKRIICSASVDDALVGFIAETDAIGIVSRQIPLLEGFPMFEQYTDADTGLSCSLVGSQNFNNGTYYISTTCLFGTNVIKENGIVTLSAEA